MRPAPSLQQEVEGLRLDHPTLAGAIAFVEGAKSWSVAELVGWFDEHLVDPGRMARPSIVSDPAHGTAPLHAAIQPNAMRRARFDDVPAIAASARARVVDTLRAFIGRPCDDRFLQAAIFAERVQRIHVDKLAFWVPSPREIDALANIALSFFVADILSHRDFYETRLCVCEVCGRVSFHPDVTTRTGCARHTPRTESTSGFQTSATPPEGEVY